MKTPSRKYWLIVASKDHVSRGMELGIAQACHGKCTPLSKMKAGDRIVFYSPKLKFEGTSSKTNNQCHSFTALATVSQQDEPYQVTMSDDFKPWRIKVEFDMDVKQQVHVKTLLDDLDFITNKKSWGMSFRNGHRSISYEDFHKIERAMKFNNESQNE
ncbi:hypothetical protein C9374_009357 [Naegleria lovaniensis]|uniref:EVE domain-containing protein n=1 Tax=Naegleria lovaniensis TaxID=51637 RepID=A0AA88GHU8_NAELO|nr:uncharacterized protein C9374_009357 [Naegleria lovaniensis]KAG2377446.1 hypothetical protein C9374_009357 [Naegleria lovaniensis]